MKLHKDVCIPCAHFHQLPKSLTMVTTAASVPLDHQWHIFVIFQFTLVISSGFSKHYFSNLLRFKCKIPVCLFSSNIFGMFSWHWYSTLHNNDDTGRVRGPFKCYVTLFSWKNDTHHPLIRLTFVTRFPGKFDTHPYLPLHYVTLEWPLTKRVTFIYYSEKNNENVQN